MNINQMIKCNTCDDKTHCRIGMSNRDVQPISFLCPHCGTDISIEIDKNLHVAYHNAIPLNEHTPIFSGGDSDLPFLDLHLDFPVWSTQYVPGMTPYIIAMLKVDPEKAGMDGGEACSIFKQKLDVLNFFGHKFEEVKQLLKLYSRANKELFRKKASSFLLLKQTESTAPQDLNALLYTVLSRVTFPFLDEQIVGEITKGYPDLILGLLKKDSDALLAFHREISDSGFLASVQKGCLSLYGRIFELELYLRPAIFLDYCSGQDEHRTAAKISRLGFEKCKDMYIDLAELFGRQLALVAGINNLLKRGDHNSFLSKDGGALSSLHKFHDKTLSDKMKYLDDSWYKIDEKILNANVRNSVAHYSFEYDDINQIIKCYPKKEGLKRDDVIQLTFLEFMRMILLLFREMHYLHHLIKAIYYFEYLVIPKLSDNPNPDTNKGIDN